MKRTTTYSVEVFDIASNGDYVNPRGEVYASWKEALHAYRWQKWYDSKNTLVQLDKTVWIHEDDEPYEFGDTESCETIYSKEIR